MASWLTRLFLLIVVTLAGAVAAGADPPAARTDDYGDPLPDDAVARLGTTRFRFDGFTGAAALSRDGTRIAVSGRHLHDASLRLLDTATGKEVKRLTANGRAPEAEVLTF